MRKSILILTVLIVTLSCNDTKKSTKTINDEQISDQVFTKSFSELPGISMRKGEAVKYSAITALESTNASISQLTSEKISNCAALPTAISQLNSGSGYEYYKFTKDNSAEASFMGFGGSIGKKEMLLIQDYVRYQEVICNGVTKRVGIGLRCFIHVKEIKSSFKGSYADIAANAQLNNMTANFSLKSLGFAMDGDLIADGLSGQNDYNVDNFGRLAVTFTNVLKTLKNNNTVLQISPVELPHTKQN